MTTGITSPLKYQLNLYDKEWGLIAGIECASYDEAHRLYECPHDEISDVDDWYYKSIVVLVKEEKRKHKKEPRDREAAILAGMEGGCEAYNAAMGYDVDFGDNYHGGWQSWED